jgi:hypothetical protein
LQARGARVRSLVRRTSRLTRLRGLGAELAFADLAAGGDLGPAPAGDPVPAGPGRTLALTTTRQPRAAATCLRGSIKR